MTDLDDLDLNIESLRWRLWALGRRRDDALWRALDQAQRALAGGAPERAGVLITDVTEEVVRFEAIARATNARRHGHLLLDRAVTLAWAKWKRKSTRRVFALRFAEAHGVTPRHVLRILQQHLGKTPSRPGRPPEP